MNTEIALNAYQAGQYWQTPRNNLYGTRPKGKMVPKKGEQQAKNSFQTMLRKRLKTVH